MTLHRVAHALRATFGPDAARAEITVARTDDPSRAPHLDGLMVHGADGQPRLPDYAMVRNHINTPDAQLPAGIYDADGTLLAPTETGDGYREALQDPDALRALNEHLFVVSEIWPYGVINDWLCSGPGLVADGTVLSVTLPGEGDGLAPDPETAITAYLRADDRVKVQGDLDLRDVAWGILDIVSRMSPEEFARLRAEHGAPAKAAGPRMHVRLNGTLSIPVTAPTVRDAEALAGTFLRTLPGVKVHFAEVVGVTGEAGQPLEDPE